MNSVLGALTKHADDVVRRNVARLLGIGSTEELARSLIERSSLSGGRVEAHEFGRDQHSSASAGAVLLGMAGIPAVTDDVLKPFFHRVGGLVRRSGAVAGHDADRVATTSSWSIAQVLLGLLIAARRLHARVPYVHKMVAMLIRLQDADSGGWPLRPGERPRLVYSFYTTLALTHVWRSGIDRGDQLARSLVASYDYLARCLRQSVAPLEELLLALRALRVLQPVLLAAGLVTADLDLAATTDSVRERAVSSTEGLLLRNLSIFTYRQPTWHTTLWRPLYWLAVRGHASPMSSLDALLGHELVAGFRHDVQAWSGPDEAGARNGASWPSALALAGTFLLASDLARHDITVDEWLNRCRELESGAFEFDVAISFAGSDRLVASEISAELSAAGYRVFYDHDQQHLLLGEDLAEYLHDMYLRRSRYAVVVVSANFLRSAWDSWEWRAMLARMQSQREAYVLPYLIEDVTLPGLNPTIGFASRDRFRPREFAQLVVRKLRS